MYGRHCSWSFLSGWTCLLAALLFLLFLAVPSDAGKDYYGILGVPKKADDQKIKRAYKKQAMKWHPDKHQKSKDKATAKFQEIAEAYEVLTDPKKRQLYDLGGEEAVKGQPQGPQANSGSGTQGPHFAHAGGRGAEIDPAMFEALLRGMSGMSSGKFQGSQTGHGNGDPFSFVFTQMSGNGGWGGFQTQGGGKSSQTSKSRKPQGGPLFGDAGNAVQEISFQSHESELQKLKNLGSLVVLFYASGGKSCPQTCHGIQSAYAKFAATRKEQVPIVAVQCLRRRGYCATYADKFPAVVLLEKGARQARVLSELKATSATELQRSLDQALLSFSGASKSKSPQDAVELTSSHFTSNGDPCGGQFCLLLLEHSSEKSSARNALNEAARMLMSDPVKVFYVEASKHPVFVAAFGNLAGSGLRGNRGDAQAVIYRPRRQSYEVFDGDISKGAALADFALKVVHRGSALPHRVLHTPTMKP